MEVREAFDQHVVVTEREEGLYDEILERAPRLAGNVRRLREEHPEISERIGRTIARLEQEQVGDEAWSLEVARDDLQRLIGQVEPAPPARRRPGLGGLQRRHRRHRVTRRPR